jgi:Tfp pilus assembly protein PilF
MSRYRELGTLSSLLLLVASWAGCAGVVTRPESPLPEPLAHVTEQSKAEACRRTAEELANHGRELQAIEQFERARRHDPHIRGVAHRLAVLLDRQGKMDAADREYRLALEESPRHPDVLNDYGFLQYQLGNLEQAANLLRQALKHDGQHARALVNLGVVLGEQRKYDEAWDAFSQGVGPAAAHHNLGMLHARHGDLAQARFHLQEALRREPGLAPAAAVLEQLNRDEQAAAWN